MAVRPYQFVVPALIAAHLCVDFDGALVIGTEIASPMATEFLNGFWLGQIVCLACWSAWENQGWRWRLPHALWLLALSSLTILAGLKTRGADGSFGIDGPIIGTFSFLTLGLSLAILSILRRCWSFRLAATDSIAAVAHSRPGQFTIRDMMLWTARVGLVLALSQWAIDSKTLEGFGAAVNAFDWLRALWIWLAVTSILAVLVGIPSIFLGLAEASFSVRWTIVCYCALVMLAAFRVRDLVTDDYYTSFLGMILLIVSASDVLVLGVVAAIIPSLWILRAAGYRLQRDVAWE